MSNKILEKIFQEATPKVEELGYELVDVDFIKEGANWYLRFFIDKEAGIEVDDCAIVSQALSDWLDEIDPIAQAYFLEVSSPGVERILKKDKDFLSYKGAKVVVSLFAPWQGLKKFEGRLGTVDQESLSIYETQDQEIKIPREKIARVNLAWTEDEEE